MIRPPSHRIDALPVIISQDDDCWDKERIAAEMKELGDNAPRHPFVQYINGATRYDLAAEILLPDGTSKAITEYMDLSKAWQFHCRRLTYTEVYRLQALISANTRNGCAEVLRTCLVRIDGPNAPKVERDGYGEVTQETIDRLLQVSWEVDLPVEIGSAAMVASKPLSPSEKKP